MFFFIQKMQDKEQQRNGWLLKENFKACIGFRKVSTALVES